VTERKIQAGTEVTGDEKEDVSSLGNERIPGIERGSTTLHSVENWLWKRLWACRKVRYCMRGVNEFMLYLHISVSARPSLGKSIR
jgi:hypothetical protein